MAKFWAYNIQDLDWPVAGFPIPALRTQPTVSLIGTLEPALPLQQASAGLKGIDLTSGGAMMHERFVDLTADDSSTATDTLQQDGANSENVRDASLVQGSVIEHIPIQKKHDATSASFQFPPARGGPEMATLQQTAK